MKKLKILITNFRLANRSGTELYTRDLADGLMKAGHEPIIYSPLLGEVSNDIRRLTIPITDSLSEISVKPDIIHGQHHPATLAALMHFRETPAVYCVHGWLPWLEIPIKFPRIVHYIAVDETCKDRLNKEHGITEDKIHVVLNFADTERFQKKTSPFLEIPKKALVFSNNATEETSIPLIRKVCKKQDIFLDVIGTRAGKKSKAPESLLTNYDIVFAKGRSAIESLVCGAAVITCDYDSIGQLVTSQNLDHMRRMNFGIRTLTNKLDENTLTEQIKKYDHKDRRRVSETMRATANRDIAIVEITKVYESALNTWKKQKRIIRKQSEYEALSKYFHLSSKEFLNISEKIGAAQQLQAINRKLVKQIEKNAPIEGEGTTV